MHQCIMRNEINRKESAELHIPWILCGISHGPWWLICFKN